MANTIGSFVSADWRVAKRIAVCHQEIETACLELVEISPLANAPKPRHLGVVPLKTG